MNKYEQLPFKNGVITWSEGRNGTTKAIGFDIFGLGNTIQVVPVNSRKKVTVGCSISIPKEHLDEFIQLLNKLR